MPVNARARRARAGVLAAIASSYSSELSSGLEDDDDSVETSDDVGEAGSVAAGAAAAVVDEKSAARTPFSLSSADPESASTTRRLVGTAMLLQYLLNRLASEGSTKFMATKLLTATSKFQWLSLCSRVETRKCDSSALPPFLNGCSFQSACSEPNAQLACRRGKGSCVSSM